METSGLPRLSHGVSKRWRASERYLYIQVLETQVRRPELLVDIVDYAVMLPPIRRHPTFTETFYVWEFSPESQLKGFNLAFEKEFLLTFFNDPHFLDRFPNS